MKRWKFKLKSISINHRIQKNQLMCYFCSTFRLDFKTESWLRTQIYQALLVYFIERYIKYTKYILNRKLKWLLKIINFEFLEKLYQVICLINQISAVISHWVLKFSSDFLWSFLGVKFVGKMQFLIFLCISALEFRTEKPTRFIRQKIQSGSHDGM